MLIFISITCFSDKYLYKKLEKFKLCLYYEYMEQFCSNQEKHYFRRSKKA